MTFYVGQKVVAVGNSEKLPVSISKAEALRHGAILPEIGAVYTIRAIYHHKTWTGLQLVEIDNSHLAGWKGCRLEPAFNAKAFRPITERKTDISIFKAMLTPKSEQVSA